MDDFERCLKGQPATTTRRRLELVLERVLWLTAAGMVAAVMMLAPETSLGATQAISAAPTSELASRVDAIGTRLDSVADRQTRADAMQEALIERLRAIEGMRLAERLATIEASIQRQTEAAQEMRGLFYTVLAGVLVVIVTQILNLKESVKHRRHYLERSPE